MREFAGHVQFDLNLDHSYSKHGVQHGYAGSGRWTCIYMYSFLQYDTALEPNINA